MVRQAGLIVLRLVEVDPLICPKCKAAMRVISSIEDPSVIRAIFKHLGIWLVQSRPPPKIHDPPAAKYVMERLSCSFSATD